MPARPSRLRSVVLFRILAGLAAGADAIRAAAPVADHDLVIYGGTSAGLAAALQADRLGKSVVLLEPGRRLGGLTTGGLGQTDIGNKQANLTSLTLRGGTSINGRNHNFVTGVDPYVVKGDPRSGLLPFIDPTGPGGPDGTGDRRVQAYCFRMCLTDHPENRLPFAKPAGYQERDYELLLRNYEAGYDKIPWINAAMPNRKTDTNNRDGFSTDFIGQNYAYGMDSHHMQRYVDAQGHVRNEGNVQAGVAGPYPISYRAITPRRSECTNLLVPVCLSSTHITFGSIRMEPVFMVLGQSAALAAALAIDGRIPVQDVPYESLQAQLLRTGQRLRR